MAQAAWRIEYEERPRRAQIALATLGIPAHALAVLEALRFDADGSGKLRRLNSEGYDRVFEFCDPAQLTLTLNHVCGSALPDSVRQRIEKNVFDYSRRFERLKQALLEIASRFGELGIDFIVLKGVTHSPDFSPDPLLRAQGDIDIWCRPEQVYAARDALSALGYRPLGSRQERHLPPMVRDTGWKWTGDYFAPDLPISVELHHRLWDEEMEAIPIPAQWEFWPRRRTVRLDGHTLPALAKHDCLGFAALHLMMHLLHGDLRLQRAWEIARFLETHASDELFWETWGRDHPAELRTIETIVFELVSRWFGCELSDAAENESERLATDIRQWVERYGLSPIKALFQPNKDELWLQLCLVESLRDKLRIIRRRVLPLRPPERLDEAALQCSASRLAQIKRRLILVGTRAVHHIRALSPVVAGGAKWWWLRTELSAGFVQFQGVSAVYCLGMSVFFLLYNLYLLGHGFRENLLGQVFGLMTAGTLAGALPAAAITRRLGLRKTLLMAILGGSSTAFLRLASFNLVWLCATAALHGVFMSLWAVSNAPAVSGLSTEENRRTAFSVSCFAGIATAGIGGLLGGRLPGLVACFSPLGISDPIRSALVIASVFTALAAWPAMSLRFPVLTTRDSRIFPRRKFLWSLLGSILLWSFAVGSFNPFFNAFLSQRWRMNVPQIGIIQACSQILQLTAILVSPLILRRLGDVKGISALLLSAGAAMALLAASPNATAATGGYVMFMSLQYMSEPGLFNMLMSRVPEAERSGASALYFLAISAAGSVAAFIGGAAITKFGYSAMLAGCSAIAMSAAFLFHGLVHEEAASVMKSPTSR